MRGADPYVYPGTDVLRNSGGFRDAQKLQAFETAVFLARQLELEQNPVAGSFDLARLKEIHHRLFQDVYPWAGLLRTIDIAKGNTRFGSHLHIESYGQKLFAGLAKEREQWRAGPGQADLPERLAYYMGEINAMHPFREGNGRTQRVFTGQLAAAHGPDIRWEDMDRERALGAAIASFTSDHRELAELLRENMTAGRDGTDAPL